MLDTFLISFRLKNTYRVNSIIYMFKQIPIIRRVLPMSLYKNQSLKIFVTILNTIWEIISVFLGKNNIFCNYAHNTFEFYECI
ncbi:hypothetical protein MBAG_03454 [Coprobacillus sp. D7]|nr:hypothetical protein MBAG_03454 [Coprobacillus sp. D7]